MEILPVTVRFCETDALGHINNTSYFIYIEEARIKFFEKLGYEMNLKNWNFILASTKCDFINQGYFNQKLSISTYLSRIGSKSFQLEHDIRSEDTNQLIAKANAIIVYFDFVEQRSDIIPDLLRARLESHLETK